MWTETGLLTSLWKSASGPIGDDYLDPDPYGQPVLYVYKRVRNNRASGGAEFVPELINTRSGTGSDVLSIDLHKDGAMDIVTATGFGTFIFSGKPRSGVKKVGL